MSHSIINEKIQKITRDHWAHRVAFLPDGTLSASEAGEYRFRVLRGIFSTLLRNQSLLSLDELSGIYPVLAARCGSGPQAANDADSQHAALIAEVCAHAGVPISLIRSPLLYCHRSMIYLNPEFEAQWDFLYGQSTVWKYYYPFEKNFDLLAEALAYYAREGVILDWEPATWADPPVPPDYSSAHLCEALRRRFAYVVEFASLFVIAVGRLPESPDLAAQSARRAT